MKLAYNLGRVNRDNTAATQTLFRCDPPMPGYPDYIADVPAGEEPVPTHEYVVVSEAHNAYAYETYIFPADSTGKITDYGELPGSERGCNSIVTVMENADYTIVHARSICAQCGGPQKEHATTCPWCRSVSR